MTIGSPHNVNKIDLNPEIKIGRLSLMGMVIDIKIAWEGYNDHVSKKVSRGIGTIKLIKPHVPKNCLNRIYNAVLTPYFDYCSLVWQDCKLELKLKLQKLRNRAARVITADHLAIRSKNVLNSLNWQLLALSGIRLFEKL